MKFLNRHTSPNKALLAFFWLFTEHGVVISCNLVTNIILARILSAGGYGVLASSLAFVLLFLPFFQFGLNAIVSKEVLNNVGDRKVVINALIIRLFSSLVFSLVSLGVLSFLPELDQNRNMIVPLLVGQFFLSFAVSEFWFHAKYKAKQFSLIRSSVLFVFCFFKIYVAYRGADLETIVLLYALENILIGFISFFVFMLGSKKSDGRLLSLRYCINLVKKSGWLLFSAIASIIYLKIDQIMILEMLDGHNAGIYAAASKLSEVSYFLPGIIAVALFPNLLTLSKGDNTTLHKKTSFYFSVLFLIGLIISITTYLISEPLVRFLFGEGFTQAHIVLDIHIWASVFIFMRALMSKLLVVHELYHLSLLSHGIGAFSNVVLNVLLIPTYGIYGAAYATILAYFLASFLVFFLHSKTQTYAMQMLLAPINLIKTGYRYAK